MFIATEKMEMYQYAERYRVVLS